MLIITARVYVCGSDKVDALKKLLEYDPYLDKSLSNEDLAKIKDDEEANVIFARQDYLLKDGAALNLDREKYYLYISAADEFLQKAEKKLKKEIEGITEADKETEEKIISTIEEERKESEQGLGLIFGG